LNRIQKKEKQKFTCDIALFPALGGGAGFSFEPD